MMFQRDINKIMIIHMDVVFNLKKKKHQKQVTNNPVIKFQNRTNIIYRYV